MPITVRLIPFLLFLLGLVARGAAPDVQPAVTPRSRTVLFDGRTLTGWTFVTKDPAPSAASIWSVADGVIRCEGKPNGYARTPTSYRDYSLHFEWRWPATPGNSGLFVHVSGPDKVWPACLEVQLKAGVAGSVRANGGAKVRELDPKAKDPINVALRQPGVEKPAGEWNSCEVVCRADSVRIQVNGVLQNLVTAASVTAGAIALQAEGSPVEFRNIVLSPLAP
jgi:hypothetical protein